MNEMDPKRREVHLVQSELDGAIRQLEIVRGVIDTIHIETLCAIRDYYQEEGWMPTVRNLGKKLNLRSTDPVDRRLSLLQKFELIERELEKGSRMKITPVGYLLLSLIDDVRKKTSDPKSTS